MTDKHETSSEAAHEAVAKLAGPERDSLIFGIGCLYFGVDFEDIGDWEQHVTETLNRLPRISDIDINVDLTSGWRTIEDNTFPIDGYVKFKVKIPVPIQRQILERMTFFAHADSWSIESYHVLVRYEYYGPVSFITIDDPSAELWNASNIPAIMREYLKKELSDRPGRVRLGFVAPTPFHGNFAVELRDQAESVLLERTPSRAFDDFIFSCSTSVFTSATAAADYVFDEIKDELTLFYYLRAALDNKRHAAEEISSLTGNLIGIYEGKGIWAWARRIFTSSSKTRSLALKALTADYNTQVRQAEDVRIKDEIYSSEVTSYFSDEIEGVMSQNFSGVISGARDVASLLTEVRARQVEITSLFVAAVAGGAAGALISLLVH